MSHIGEHNQLSQITKEVQSWNNFWTSPLTPRHAKYYRQVECWEYEHERPKRYNRMKRSNFSFTQCKNTQSTQEKEKRFEQYVDSRSYIWKFKRKLKNVNELIYFPCRSEGMVIDYKLILLNNFCIFNNPYSSRSVHWHTIVRTIQLKKSNILSLNSAYNFPTFRLG
jgi:hypothetical protein